VPNQRPNKNFANAYSGALHYLKAAAAMGVANARADGRATVAQMKAMPVEDPLFGVSHIREDGQTLRDMLLLKIKSPNESREPFDYCSIELQIPADQAARPLKEGGCKLIKA
jgi:branched-chain amino acid transport system substrate-binding protein